MPTAYERQRVWSIAWNLIKHKDWNLKLSERVLFWLDTYKEYLKIPVKMQNVIDSSDNIKPNMIWSKTKNFIEKQGTSQKNHRPDLIEIHIRHVGELFELDPIDLSILRLAVLYQTNDPYESLFDSLLGSNQNAAKMVSCIIGVKVNIVLDRLKNDSRLVVAGLVESFNSNRPNCNIFQVSDSLLKVVEPPRKGLLALRQALLGNPSCSDLIWDDFEHLGQNRDLMARVIKGAMTHDEQGVNILLYGSPGTGKTEFCKVVAAKLGMKIYSVGEADEDGGEPSRSERLKSLRSTQALLANQRDAMILFDEMEDVFALNPFADNDGQSRAFMHRLLEGNRKPILWTCNHIDMFDRAILRRMSMVLEIKTPPPRVRERIWGKVLERQNIKLSDESIRTLSKEFEAAPAVAANAARAARLAGGGWDDIRSLVHGVNRAISGRRAPMPTETDEKPFDADLAHADINLSKLAQRIEHSGASQFSLCLYGPPGTGKSAYARHLAERLGMPVIQKRASDLLSPFVGGSEENIAAAFENAKSEGAMLIFDEADSLIADRRSARQSWEVTQVNEMLTWMENHPLPFVCTTNLMDNLDQASFRRFTFKVKFDFLNPEKVRQAFVLFFGIEPPAGRLIGLSRLTPGDFS